MANTAFDHASALTIPGSTTNNGLVRWGDTSGTSFGNITGITSDGSNITLLTRGEIRFSDADSTHFIALESPATVSTSYTMTLPAAVPSAADYLKVTSYSGGAGVLEWASVSADTNTTYTTSWVDSSANAILRLTPSSGSADDLTIVAGSNITLTPSGDNLTIAAAGGSQTPWTGNIDAGNYTLSNVGVSGNSWTATALLMRHSVSGGQIAISAYNESNTSGSTAKLRSRTGGSSAGDPYMEFEITSGGQFLMGVDNSASDYFVLGGQGSALGSNDTFRVTSATPPVFSLNTSQGSNFDYVCSTCGNHDLEMFTCCGVVEWHDDVLALRKAGVDLATMTNPYAIGQSLNIAHLVKLGIMNYDDQEEDPVALANRKTPWLGINISNAQMFTWAGMWQTRERMDNQYQELKDTIQELKAEVDALRG